MYFSYLSFFVLSISFFVTPNFILQYLIVFYFCLPWLQHCPYVFLCQLGLSSGTIYFALSLPSIITTFVILLLIHLRLILVSEQVRFSGVRLLASKEGGRTLFPTDLKGEYRRRENVHIV